MNIRAKPLVGSVQSSGVDFGVVFAINIIYDYKFLF